MTDHWIDHIPTLNAPDFGADLPLMFPDQADRQRRRADARVALPADTPIRSAVRSRHRRDSMIADAAADLAALPNDGETVRLVLRPRWWDISALVAAIVGLLQPATVREFTAATFGISRTAFRELFRLQAEGRIERVRLLVSAYYRTVEAEVVNELLAAAEGRQTEILFARNHAKVFLLETSDGRYFAVESSANLQGLQNHETVAITHDRAVYDFHRRWIADLGEAHRQAKAR